MNKAEYDLIVAKVLQKLIYPIRVEASGRHVHLSESDALTLFGTTELSQSRELSQPGQYLYKEKVNLIGPKGIIKDVAILGPCRGNTQVELAITDMRAIGVQPVIRDSGDLSGAGDVIIMAGSQVVTAKSAAIVAKRHLHMTPDDAKRFSVNEGQLVAVRVYGSRKLIFEDVLVRVSPKYSLSMHLDYDEANAVGLTVDAYGEIVWI